MDKSTKVNNRAGIGGRYRPGPTANQFGRPNMARPQPGVPDGTTRTSARAGSKAPADHAGKVASVPDPGMSTDNSLPHPAGVSGSAPRLSPGFPGNRVTAVADQSKRRRR